MEEDNYSVSGSQNVTLRAGDFVELLPNTSYETTEIFEAYIQDCVFAPRKIDETKIENILNSEIDIFPNPSSSTIEIVTKSTTFGTVIVQSLEGKIVYNDVFEPVNYLKINIDRFEKGIYLVLVTTNSGKLISRKLIKN